MSTNNNFFSKTLRIQGEIKKIGSKAAKELYDTPDLLKYLNEIFSNEYLAYVSNEQFFPGCPFNIYMKHYRNRFEEFQMTYPDADEFDFLKDEDALFWQLAGMDVDSKNNFYPFYPHLYSDPHRANISLSISKMHNFIDERIIELGHYLEGPAGVDPIDYDLVPRSAFEFKRNFNVKDSEIVLDINKELKPLGQNSNSKEIVNNGQIKEVTSFKDWFKNGEDYTKIFDQLSHVFEVSDSEIRYIGLNSEIKAISYLVIYLMQCGYLKKIDRVNTQKSINPLIRNIFNLHFTDSAFSQFKRNYDSDDPCARDIEPHISNLEQA